MMEKKNRTKAAIAIPAAIKAQPGPTADEIIEEILRAAGLEAL
ncbi:MAG TPA: hypothetical protein VNT01_05310 [Symbiobacteriaceae bacterium]|nr:hypothetical protein [Symbiobacteriaceae bacterium]